MTSWLGRKAGLSHLISPVQTTIREALDKKNHPHEKVLQCCWSAKGRMPVPSPESRKPVVPSCFLSDYRLYLSNCINSGVRWIYILTQYKSVLDRHIQSGWNFLRCYGRIYKVIPAQQRIHETSIRVLQTPYFRISYPAGGTT
jgi:hypothetical protein